MKLSEHPFIQSISTASQREAAVSEVELLTFKDQETVFHEDSGPDALYLILDGGIVFTKQRADGSSQEVSQSAVGSFFGEVGVFTGDSRALGAQAKGMTTLGVVSKQLVKEIIGNIGPVHYILESLADHLKSTTRHYLDEMIRTEKLTYVGTMIATILHDFRNPLSIISLAKTLIERKHGDDPQTLERCRKIDLQINRMVAMANDLSAFSQGDHALNVGKISLSDLFQHFEDLNTPFFKDQDIELNMSAKNVWIEADADKFLRALQNLIFNSREALNQADGVGQINVIASNVGDHILLSVRDNGPGIPEEIQATLFDPFVTFGKKGGTGLGTSIVKSIVEAHHGSIDFETSSRGTCFTITLPKVHLETPDKLRTI